jgi:hypothetical protein
MVISHLPIGNLSSNLLPFFFVKHIDYCGYLIQYQGIIEIFYYYDNGLGYGLNHISNFSF